jgi:protein TonB
MLIAVLVGGAVLVGTHHHSVGVSATPPRDVKPTPSPASLQTGDAVPDAVPSLPGASDDLQPPPPVSTEPEKVKAEPRSLKSVKSTSDADDTPQADGQKAKRSNDLVAKPTFKWLGDDSNTPPKEEKKGVNNPPKTAVLGEKAAAPSPTAVGTDTRPSAEPVSVSSDVMAANLLLSPSPAYPEMAKLTHQQGPVVVQAIISKNGKVDSVHVVKGNVLLRRAATTAVMNWRYRPYVLNGQPVNVATTITVNFSSPGANLSSTDNSN